MLGVSQSRGHKLFGREIIFEEFQPMCSRYLIVTDGQTDRQTDRRLTVASPRSALASRGKNGIWCDQAMDLVTGVILQDEGKAIVSNSSVENKTLNREFLDDSEQLIATPTDRMICINCRFYDEQGQKLPIDNAVNVMILCSQGSLRRVQLKKYAGGELSHVT